MILLLLALVLSVPAFCQERDSLLLVFWNIENFFDYRSEAKPSPYWTRKRFYAKCEGIAKTLLRIADRYGRLPDAVGLAEVENRYVLQRLLSETALRKLDYRIVHYDSPDPRGIDCALLHRESTLPLRRSAACPVTDSSGTPLLTRDILVAEFDSIALLVNHHPSQLGGKEERRTLARRRRQALADSLLAAGAHRVLSMGDFNEDLWSEGASPKDARRGTIKYNGAWEKIDGHFAAGALQVREEVFGDPLLLEADNAFGGMKPRRTFVGPRYNKGISDHLPVVFVVNF